MESQQIVDYIRQQLAAGHTEMRLRQHLLVSGWTQPQIEAAFQQYHRATGAAAKPAKKSRMAKMAKPRRKRTRANSWTLGKSIKLGLAVAVVAVALVGLRTFMDERQPSAPPHVAPHYSAQQLQALDVNTVGSAVGEYSVTTGDLPAGTTVGSDGHLVLCGTSCDPSVGEVVSLVTYNPATVKMQHFAPNLTVPDANTMYIVPGATCENKGASINASSKPKAAVILYAQPKETQLTQRCVIL